MSAGIWFWLIFVLCFVFHGLGEAGTIESGPKWGWPRSIVLFVLIGLLGWGIFGSPLK